MQYKNFNNLCFAILRLGVDFALNIPFTTGFVHNLAKIVGMFRQKIKISSVSIIDY